MAHLDKTVEDVNLHCIWCIAQLRCVSFNHSVQFAMKFDIFSLSQTKYRLYFKLANNLIHIYAKLKFGWRNQYVIENFRVITKTSRQAPKKLNRQMPTHLYRPYKFSSTSNLEMATIMLPNCLFFKIFIKIWCNFSFIAQF